MHCRRKLWIIFATFVAPSILLGLCEELCERDGDEHCAARGSAMLQIHHVANGKTAPLNEAGYKAVAKLKKQEEMEIYIKRIIKHRGLHILDEGSLKGMVPYYCGKKATQSYKALSEELNKALNGKKRWLISSEALDRLEKKARSRKSLLSKNEKWVLSKMQTKAKMQERGKKFVKGTSFPEAILHTAGQEIAVGNGRFSEELLAANVDKTKKCLVKGLQEAHFLAVQTYAPVLAIKEKERKEWLAEEDRKEKEEKERKEKERKEALSEEDRKKEEEKEAKEKEEKERKEAAEKEKEEQEKKEEQDEKQPSLEDMEAPTEATEEKADESSSTPPLVQPPPPGDDMIGSTAMLTASGFKSVTERCCPIEMEIFFTRLLSSRGYEVCSVPHVQGLMHWFSCVPDMDFQYMIQVIEEGNPCKYWSPAGEKCPKLSAKCEGTYCR